MFASVTDYSALYDDAYRAARGEHTSFNPDKLVPIIAGFCKSTTLTALLDVSGGQGGLGRHLKHHGIETITTDIGALPGSDILPLDLSQYSEAATRRVKTAIRELGRAYLTTCFDVLEHIDREHLSSAVQTLFELTERLLIVSISTRPSKADNLLHATLMPIPTWVKLFERAGFAQVNFRDFTLASSKPTFPNHADLALVSHWFKVDPFDDIKFGEPQYLVFERDPLARSNANLNSEIEHIVDVGYRRRKREQFAHFSGSGKINLSIHFIQEWYYLRPLLDVMKRDNVRVLLRQGIGESFSRAIAAYLHRNGVEVIQYEHVDELPWASMVGQKLVSAAESTVGGGHLRAYELVSMAKLHGCRTTLLQHGIWPRAFSNRVVTFASERVVTWGSEEQHRINERFHDVLSAHVPWGVLPPTQVFAAGSPKFTEQLLGPIPELHLKLGYGKADFRKTVLLATKNLLRRGQPNIDEVFLQQLKAIISNNPDVLFIIRPHPVDPIDEYLFLRGPNVRILDELTCIISDISPSRIIPCVDLIVTPPSSMVVDASIRAKPLVVYDGGGEVEIDQIQCIPLEDLNQILSSSAIGSQYIAQSTSIKSLYAASVNEEFYSKFASLLEDMNDRLELNETIAAQATLARIAVEQMRPSVTIPPSSKAIVVPEPSPCDDTELAMLESTNVDSAGEEKGLLASLIDTLLRLGQSKR